MIEPPSRLFEHLYTRQVHARWEPDEALADLRALTPDQAAERLARHLSLELARVLRSLPGQTAHRLRRQADLTNQVLNFLRAQGTRDLGPEGEVLVPPRELLALDRHHAPARTALPFSESTLLTRGRGEPALAHELAREIETADRIEALVSFVTVGGVRTLRPALERYVASGRRLRLLTTTYMGATEEAALDWLGRLPGIEIRISHDARRSRLHAKAWLFRRENGLDTAYVGSANWSRAALTEGQEWMIKASSADLHRVISRFEATFETLWHDPEFEPYVPDDPACRARLRAALRHERGGDSAPGELLTFFTLRPYPFQEGILERLEAERTVHGRMRNLVVAATGTGKTMIAAFDYARRIPASGLRPSLLVLAHRQELLLQARSTFRQVLRDGAFGDLLADGHEPDRFDHLFATIQSFRTRDLATRLGADHWNHVIVDEVHHAPAESYRPVMTALRPEVLVGLTATPERADGRSLLEDFGGQLAAELRLWDALEQRLLVPFEYHMLSDDVDLRQVSFTRGQYAVQGLDRVYTGNDRRAELVLEQLRQRVASLREIRALGFCVSVDHAAFMARVFTEHGVPAVHVHGDSSAEERRAVRQRLEQRQVNVVFTCDLYNEGVDLPFVDTLLLLRPTSSATLFLQQLGRGLRLHGNKSICLVLDFVGLHADGFRFDTTLSALSGLPRGALQKAVEAGFPLLPSGCQIVLDRVSQEQIVGSLRRSLRGGLTRLRADLLEVVARHGREVTLEQFLADTGRELEEVFTKEVSWMTLRRAAGLEAPDPGPDGPGACGRVRYLLHLDEPERLVDTLRWLRGEASTSTHGDRWRRMLAHAMFPEKDRLFPGDTLASWLAAHPAVRADLETLFEVLLDRVELASREVPGDGEWPLALHRRYVRREILTAVGRWTEAVRPDMREGVLRLEAQKTELLFVTLNKSSDRFTPSTRYEDYAIDAHLFHWQTQSLVTPESVAGQRYIRQRDNGWRFLLFVRASEDDAYTYLGPVAYVQHAGSRPMSIVWRLETPMPGHDLQRFLAFAG